MTEGDKIGGETIREEEETNFEMKDFNAKKQNLIFTERVQTHKGCWYHNWHDHNPSLMQIEQLNQDVVPFSPAQVKQHSTKCTDKNNSNKHTQPTKNTQ